MNRFRYLGESSFLGKPIGKKSYADKMKSLFGSSLIAYWPLWEPSGTVMTEIKNGNNGSYTNFTLGLAGIGDGRTGVQSGLTSIGNLYTAALNTLFNNSELTMSIWAKIAATEWADSTLRWLACVAADFDDRIGICKKTTNNYVQLLFQGTSGGSNTKYVDVQCFATGWQCFTITVSKANDRLRAYLNGVQSGADVGSLGTWTGALANNRCVLAGNRTDAVSGPFVGGLAHLLLLNREATPAEVVSIGHPFDCRYVLFEGDSKTGHADWTEQVRDGLSNNQGIMWLEVNNGTSEYKAEDKASECDADIAAMTYGPTEMTVNLGANDISGTPTPPNDYYDSMEYLINAYHNAFPTCNIRLATVWKRGFPADVANLAAKIALLNTNYSWLKPGIDERNILPGADDGATMTTDGTHYSEAGKDAIATSWLTAMGY